MIPVGTRPSVAISLLFTPELESEAGENGNIYFRGEQTSGRREHNGAWGACSPEGQDDDSRNTTDCVVLMKNGFPDHLPIEDTCRPASDVLSHSLRPHWAS